MATPLKNRGSQTGAAVHDPIERTVALWESRTHKKCSREDAREMLANVAGFFGVLAEWDRRASQEQQMAPFHRGAQGALKNPCNPAPLGASLIFAGGRTFADKNPCANHSGVTGET
jgi:hypothetical protein